MKYFFIFAPRKSSQKKENMSNTYTQIHIQTVFAVKFREALISPVWSDRLYQFIVRFPTVTILVVIDVEGETRDFGMDKQRTSHQFPIPMAKWLWSVFVFQEPRTPRHQIHFESGSASREEVVPRGISGYVEEE